jgi:hypothetical protein
MEQDPPNGRAAVLGERAANGTEVEVVLAVLRQLGQTIHKLKRGESCDAEMKEFLSQMEDIRHQLANKLHIYLMDKELAARGM